MKNHLLRLFAFAILTLSFTATMQAQVRPYTATDTQLQLLLNRIETRTDAFRRSMNTALDNSSLNGTESEDAIVSYISEFETSTDMLSEKFTSRRSVDADVEDVLGRAAAINQFMQNNRLTAAAQSNWNYLRTDLDTLARYYGVSWNWRNSVTTNTTTSTSTRSYRVTDATVQALLSRIETSTDAFKRSVGRSVNRQNTSTDITQYIADFETETDRLTQRFNSRQSVSTDVSSVLTRASAIDSFLRNNRLNAAAERNWTLLKSDLETLAGYYDISWNWTNPPINNNGNTNVGGLPYRVSDTNVRTLLSRLDLNTDNYRRQIMMDLDRSALNNTRSEDSMVAYITEFENAVDRLKQNFESRRSATTDVDEVLNRAAYIDSFMRDYRFSTTTNTQWTTIRRDLDTLTNYYSATWDWNRPTNQQATRFDQMLNGTYRLNLNQSDNVAEVVERATATGYQTTMRDRAKNNLQRRLTPPDTLAIEKVGTQVTIASGNAPQVTFTADGTARTEAAGNGRSVKITATTGYDGVSLNYEGERMNDFYVNFIPMSNGQLRVVRRVYLENRNETVTVASVYDKVSPTAQWSQIDNNQNTTNGSLNNTFAVPNNTKMTAILTTPVSTKASQSGDRFQMEVTSPSQFNGAIIEGRVAKAERSGRVSGRAQVSLEFDTIRLRNGETYRFAGFVDGVRLTGGETVSVNNEGTVRDNNQTTKTATRAGIGAALGAIIGAIAGGGTGAAIGAGVGAGAGAGTVILQGRDDVELNNGTEFSITASAPANVSINR
jgi:hypothetical protein